MNHIDFLPERIREARVRRQRLILRIGLLCVCAIAMVGLSYGLRARIATARGEVRMLESRSDNASQQASLRSSLEAQLADLMMKKEIEEALGRRVSVEEVLSELQRVLPESMAVSTLSLETVDVRLPVESAKAAAGGRAARSNEEQFRSAKRVRVILTGLALTNVDVANFIGQLSSSPMFEDVNMGYAKDVTFRGRSARQFQASCYVVR
jgi:Tfp pilus assembly protein PilN